MSLIRRGIISLSFEYMTQMASTIRANNLSSCHAQCLILMPGDSTGYTIKIGRPATVRLELVLGGIEGSVAAGAGVDAGAAGVGEVAVVFSCEGGFGALFA